MNAASSIERAKILPVFEKLRPLLATFMGRAGYRALIFRALVLARVEIAWLCDVEITVDGRLENFAELADKHEPAEVSQGSEVLLARLLGLLEEFIGEALTQRFLYELWPSLTEENYFTHGNEDE